MQNILSRDGTRIAYVRLGDGPPIVMVVGAFNEHSTALPLAEALAPDFSAYVYDRRGRGQSGDAPRYTIEREIEDIAALIDLAGGSAGVFGYSSGATLALHAAAADLPITRLALYDTPMLLNPAPGPDHAAHLAELVSAGKRGEAVEYFQTELVGIPPQVVAQLRQAPFRPALEGMAQTLVYEAVILGERGLPDSALAARVRTPVLAIAGASMPIMPPAAEGLARLLPNAQARILEGQGHDIDPAVLAPVLRAFFSQAS